MSAIDRYVTYALALALVLMTVLIARPALLSRTARIVAALLSLTLLARPAIQMIGEERATWSISYRLDHALGLGLGIGLTLIARAAVDGRVPPCAWSTHSRSAGMTDRNDVPVLVICHHAAWLWTVKTASVAPAMMRIARAGTVSQGRWVAGEEEAALDDRRQRGRPEDRQQRPGAVVAPGALRAGGAAAGVGLACRARRG